VEKYQNFNVCTGTGARSTDLRSVKKGWDPIENRETRNRWTDLGGCVEGQGSDESSSGNQEPTDTYH
jgi:hypothetical protein